MEELYSILPDEYVVPIKTRLLADKLCEVRVNNCAPVRVCYDGTYFFLCKTGITRDKSTAFVAGAHAAEGIVMRACEHSLYTVTDTLKRGYISVRGGIRIGVCGAGVMNGGALVSVKDYSSVNVRLPHEVKGCGNTVAAKLLQGGIENTLIVSPPGAGKTTVLRDVCRIISDKLYKVLLCDEKYEIASVTDGVPTLDVGCCTDVISGTDKQRVFEFGIANLSPDVIMTDEIFDGDIPYVSRAARCGIAVVATMHAQNADDLRKKSCYAECRELFKYIAVLSGAPRRSVEITEERGDDD